MTPRDPISRWLRSVGLDANPLGTITLLTLIVTLVLGAFIVYPFIQSSRAQPIADAKKRDAEKSLDAFDQSMHNQVALIDGRFPFGIPPKPDAKPQTTVAKSYAGPALIAYVNGTAWFSDGQKISEDKPKARTLELVSANPPWSVRVKWENGEFDVELFKKVPLSSLNDPVRSNSTSLWTTTGGRGAGASVSNLTPQPSITPPAAANQGPGQSMFNGMSPGGPPLPGSPGGPGGNGGGGPRPPGAQPPTQGDPNAPRQGDPPQSPPAPEPAHDPARDPAPAPAPSPEPPAQNPEPSNPPSPPSDP